MKLRRNKKGFTIIELVIVIAVIGILAAVLIPTFVNLTNKANEASDNALINNLNKALKIEEQEAGHKKAETLEGAIVDLEKQGYILENLVTKSGKELIWSQSENQFLTDPSGKEGENYWKIVDAVPTNLDAQKYSYYAGQNFNDTSVTVKYGFDAGRNDKITTVTYQRSGSGNQTVSIRTLGGNLVVNAQNDSVKHYGNLNNLTVTAVYDESYHENGIVAVKAELVRGKLEVGAEGYIKEIDTTNAVSGASLVVDGFVSKVKAAAGEGAVVPTAGTGYVPSVQKGEEAPVTYGEAAAAITSINNISDLAKFREKVNGGQSYEGLTVKLNANLDLTGMAWAPIGKAAHPFIGTFDGAGHTIKGLTNAGYVINADDVFTTETALNTGVPYGFFSVVGGVADGTTTIKNLTLDQVNIDIVGANTVGGLFAATSTAAKQEHSLGIMNIENVTVKGSIKANNPSGVAVGGIIGKLYHEGRANIVNCTSEVNITVNEGVTGDVKAAGVAAWASDIAGIYVFNGCKNFGDMNLSTSAFVYAAGIVNASDGVSYIKACKTQGRTIINVPVAPATKEVMKVFYSVLARLTNHNTTLAQEIHETYSFEDVSYYMYDYDNLALKIYMSVEGCGISTESGYSTFETIINQGDAEQVRLTADTEGLDYMNLYPFRWNRIYPNA